jgi:hypothetical protein
VRCNNHLAGVPGLVPLCLASQTVEQTGAAQIVTDLDVATAADHVFSF